MALPQWLSIAFSIADFVVQRVDRVGPVSFEPPEKQPPEHAAETVDAPKMGSTGVDEAPPAEVDQPSSAMGFRAGGGGQPSSGDTPTGGDDDDDDDDNGGEEQFVDRAGGGNDPTPAPPPDPDGDDDDDDNGEEQNVVQCSFRAMRPSDQHNRYEVEKARDDAGEERPA
jgi:hypothetical protein